MFSAYKGNTFKRPNGNGNAAPQRSIRDETREAVQVLAAKTLAKNTKERAEKEEDEVIMVSGYGESDSDDDCGGVRIKLEEERVIPASQIFELPEKRKIREEKERKQMEANNKRKNYPFGSNRFDVPSTSSYATRKRSRSPPRNRSSYGTSRPSKSRSTSRSSNESYDSLQSRETHSSQKSYKRKGDKDRKKKKKRRRRSSSEESTSSRNSRSTVSSHRSSSSSKPSNNTQQEKYSFLENSVPIDMTAQFMVNHKKFDPENYSLGIQKKEVAKCDLATNFIDGMEHNKTLFKSLYGKEIKTENKVRDFYDELAQQAREPIVPETRFIRPENEEKIDGYVKLYTKKHVLNELNKEGLDSIQNIQHLTKAVRDCPSDIPKYFELMAAEEEACEQNCGSFVRSNPKAVAERHLALIEKGIKSNPASYELYLAQARTYYKLKENKDETLDNYYRKACSRFPNEPLTWINSLDFVQYNQDVYNTQKLRTEYKKSLDSSFRIMNGGMLSHPAKDIQAFCDFYLFTYIRYLKWLMAIRSTPIALACIQGTMEMHFGMGNERMDPFQRSHLLESFWECKVWPRIGDEGAIGAKNVMNVKWEQSFKTNVEKKIFADRNELLKTIKEGVKQHLQSSTDKVQNWIDFERFMSGADARVQRISFENTDWFGELNDDDLVGIAFWESIDFKSEVSDRIDQNNVISFFDTRNANEFTTQPILELLGVEFLHSTGCYTSSEQVISEWIGHSVFKNYRPNFEEVPTYSEDACLEVGINTLLFLIKEHDTKYVTKSHTLDKHLVRYVLALALTRIAQSEKLLNGYYTLKKEVLNTVLMKTVKGLAEVYESYPRLTHIVLYVSLNRLIEWIGNGVEEQIEIKRLDKERERHGKETEENRILEHHFVIEQDERKLADTKGHFINFLNNLDKKLEKGEDATRSLDDINLPMYDLQLRLYSLIIRSKLFFFDEVTRTKIREKLAYEIMEEDKAIINNMDPAILGSRVEQKMQELQSIINDREESEVSRIPELPRARVLCEVLHYAATFVFLDKNERSRTVIRKIKEVIEAKANQYVEHQMDFSRPFEERAQDKIDMQFRLDTLLELFSHQKLHVTYYEYYKYIVTAASGLFPCHTKYKKLVAQLLSVSRFNYIQMSSDIREDSKEIRMKQNTQFNVDSERRLLLNSLTLMYADKIIRNKVGGSPKRNWYKTVLHEARQLRDPVVWRIALRAAADVSPVALRDEVFTSGREQCIWSHNFLFDFLELWNQKGGSDMFKQIHSDILEPFKSDSNYNHPLFITDADYELLQTHLDLARSRHQDHRAGMRWQNDEPETEIKREVIDPVEENVVAEREIKEEPMDTGP